MPFEPPDPHYKQKVRDSFARQPFMAFIGAELARIAPGFCEIHLPFKKELSQQHGYFHAGIIGTLADNCAGYAAYSLMPANSSVLTVEYKLNLLSPGNGRQLIGRGEVKKAGRTLTVCHSEVFVVGQDGEKLCAAALITIMRLEEKTRYDT